MTLRAAAEQALKPCPFCGSEPYSCRHLSYSNWGVTCECGAIGPTKNAGYRPLREAEIRAHNEAVAAWNERAALAAEQPEPVAWRWLSSDGLEWLFVERRSWAPSIKGVEVEPLYTAPPPAAEPSEASANERRLRRLLCAARHRHSAYMDDGEASDCSVHPSIDYLRDSLDEIEAKWRMRASATPAAPTEPGEAQDAARYRWLRDSEEGVEFRDGRGRWRADCPSGADLDAAIDAALRAAAAARKA